MAKKVRVYLKRPDGTPWFYPSVLAHAVERMQEASKKGAGLRLSAEEIRALDYAVIRESGGVKTDCFRDHAFGDEPSHE